MSASSPLPSSGERPGPEQRYLKELRQGEVLPDEAQAAAVSQLQGLYDELIRSEGNAGGVLRSLASWLGLVRGPEPVQGLYFWGGVGRGKTWLMDLFFESLPMERKLRTHFHRFMQRVHRELTLHRGQKNPLELVAASIASEARVLCFDEFYVSDIGDAMILGGLLEHLFGAGVTLVATSNIVPERLYENGLQRARFLPAIELIQRHCRVLELDGGIDYRLRSLEQARLYYSPAGSEAEQALYERFRSLSGGLHDTAGKAGEADAGKGGSIEILGREIPYRYCAEEVIWFDFDSLCGEGRSQNDYIELARLFHSVVLSDVPVMDAERDDQGRRFINLVDELYDRHVKLIISAQAAIESLYTGTRLRFPFERTQSRLLEMQSHDYLVLEHRPD